MTKVCEFCQIGVLDRSGQCPYCGAYETEVIQDCNNGEASRGA